MNVFKSIFKNSASAYKRRRFLAFILDAVFVCMILMLFYTCFGFPDFPAVQMLMNKATAAQGTPAATDAANAMFSAFNTAYLYTLLIWFAYEIISMLILKGATVGKYICGLKTTTMKKDNGKPADGAIKTAFRIALRTVFKFLFVYFFQGLPFLVSQLSIYANKDHRSGTDVFAGTIVIDARTQTD